MKRHLFFSGFVSVLVASIWLLSSLHPAQAVSFPDIKSPLLQEAVSVLVDRGVVEGYPDGTFRPEAAINRAEALKMIFASSDLVEPAPGQVPFSDVAEEDWFSPYVSQALQQGLVRGYEDGTFKPGQRVNTVEFIKIAMLAQDFFQYPSLDDYPDAIAQFSDVSMGDWYLPTVTFAFHHGLVEKHDSLESWADMTRARAALILYRTLQKAEEMDQQHALSIEEMKANNGGSCPLCVAGRDFSPYKWLSRPYIEIIDHRFIVNGKDLTEEVRTGWLDPARFHLSLHMDEQQYVWKSTPREQKLQVDQLFPDLYERALSIHGGSQVGQKYFGGSEDKGHERVVRNRDGIALNKCDCVFEQRLVGFYNNRFLDVPFEAYLASDDGKAFIFDMIYGYSLKPDTPL